MGGTKLYSISLRDHDTSRQPYKISVSSKFLIAMATQLANAGSLTAIIGTGTVGFHVMAFCILEHPQFFLSK